MIRTEQHGDVTRYEFAGWRNRVVKLSVSIFELRGVWIDTGFPRAAPAVRDLLTAQRPRGVLITHRHEDHAGNAELLASHGIPLGMPVATAGALAAPLAVGLYRRQTWGAPPPLRSPVTAFAPNDLELRPTPGHSEDHHVVWDPSTGTLFSADLFIGVKVSVAHSYEDPRRIVQSLLTAASWVPSRMFDAHRGLVKDPVKALLAKADWLASTIGRIDDHIDAGLPDREIARRMLAKFDLWGAMSFGDYSQLNFVAAVRRGRPPR
ncbi:MAG: MBL fold metallo-hydrolase [Gemmatimonadaceae bacterium]